MTYDLEGLAAFARHRKAKVARSGATCINKKGIHNISVDSFFRKGVENMPISQQDKLNLLKDILSNHRTDCCGSVSECEQLRRLVKSLMVHPSLNANSLAVLKDIYNYSQNGVNSSQLDEHIEAHQQELTQWVSDIEQMS